MRQHVYRSTEYLESDILLQGSKRSRTSKNLRHLVSCMPRISVHHRTAHSL